MTVAGQRIAEIVRELIGLAGDSPTRGGLQETPDRVARAYEEWFGGYGENPADLFKVFEDGGEKYAGMVMVANIPVYSHCEHHMTPFFGLAHVAYIPSDGKLIGLSKVARLVDIFAHRLQVQERLTDQVALALVENLQPAGVGVVMECRHLCMESRGAQVRGTLTTTSSLHGAMDRRSETRAEFFSLVQSASKARNGL